MNVEIQLYKTYKQRIEVCDLQIVKQLQQYEASRNNEIIETINDKKDEPAIRKKQNES